MRPKVELDSLTVSKSQADLSSFIKYDIDATLDEVTATEKLSKLKFSFTTLSDPKNIRLVVDGFVTIEGSEHEREKMLENDKNSIPKILNLIYQDLFATFFMLSKSIQIPCPPHILGKITKASVESSEQKVEETKTEVAMGFGGGKQKVVKPEVKTEEVAPEEVKTEEVAPEEVKTEEVAPEEVKTEDNFENLPYEKLTSLYEKLTKEYSENPTEKLRDDLGKISELLSKGQQNQEQVEAAQV